MTDRDDRIARPWWVQLGLWGLPTRASAWAFFWLSLALAAAAVVLGLAINPLFFFGAGLVFAAWWYYASIRWVDQHDRWA